MTQLGCMRKMQLSLCPRVSENLGFKKAYSGTSIKSHYNFGTDSGTVSGWIFFAKEHPACSWSPILHCATHRHRNAGRKIGSVYCADGGRGGPSISIFSLSGQDGVENWAQALAREPMPVLGGAFCAVFGCLKPVRTTAGS